MRLMTGMFRPLPLGIIAVVVLGAGFWLQVQQAAGANPLGFLPFDMTTVSIFGLSCKIAGGIAFLALVRMALPQRKTGEPAVQHGEPTLENDLGPRSWIVETPDNKKIARGTEWQKRLRARIGEDEMRQFGGAGGPTFLGQLRKLVAIFAFIIFVPLALALLAGLWQGSALSAQAAELTDGLGTQVAAQVGGVILPESLLQDGMIAEYLAAGESWFWQTWDKAVFDMDFVAIGQLALVAGFPFMVLKLIGRIVFGRKRPRRRQSSHALRTV
jgi:hypothetical protein